MLKLARGMLTEVQYRVLRTFFPRNAATDNHVGEPRSSRLRVLLGDELLKRVVGKTVVDFGCGEGYEAIEMAACGATKVIGVDIRDEVLSIARRNAQNAGVAEWCEFTTSAPPGAADVIISIDAFEHFGNPAEILKIMDRLLKPRGEVLISFGPTWLHPMGGHTFSVFPWAHLVFSEDALIRWRADFKSDGATRFSEVAGGLNQMTIARFERLIQESPFRAECIATVPIRRLKRLHNQLTREFTTAIVRCRLVKRTRA